MQKTSGFIKQASGYLTVLAVGAALMIGSVVSAAGYAQDSAGPDITTLELDRNGADVEAPIVAHPAARADVATLYLDRDGADIPEGNWWGTSDEANVAVVASVDTQRGPDITTLNLDRNGADIFAD